MCPKCVHTNENGNSEMDWRVNQAQLANALTSTGSLTVGSGTSAGVDSSAVGGRNCEQFRECICGAKQAAPRCALRARRASKAHRHFRLSLVDLSIVRI